MCLYLISISSNDDVHCDYILYPFQAMMIMNVSISYIMVINVYVYLHDDLFLAMSPKKFVILGPATGYRYDGGDKAPYYRDDIKRGDIIYILYYSQCLIFLFLSRHNTSLSPSLSSFSLIIIIIIIVVITIVII